MLKEKKKKKKDTARACEEAYENLKAFFLLITVAALECYHRLIFI